MKPNFLEVIDINKKFGNINALKNVSLNVSKGEVICIIGPSGCGKSTLLRTVNWLTPPDSGKVILKGEIIGSATGKLTFEQTDTHDRKRVHDDARHQAQSPNVFQRC